MFSLMCDVMCNVYSVMLFSVKRETRILITVIRYLP